MIRSRRLAPTIVDRLRSLLTPGWERMLWIRRGLAVVLAGLGVVLLVRGDPDSAAVPVVSAAHDLVPGRVLTGDDVRTVYRPAGTLPAGSLTDLDHVVGHTTAGAVRTGEALTDVRVLGPRLAVAATGSANARVVPLRLADTGVAELLREGDRVDVVAKSEAAPAHDPDVSPIGIDKKTGTMPTARPTAEVGTFAPPKASVVASDAIVVLVSAVGPGGRAGARDRVVMVALPATSATAVAVASLTDSLTVVFH